MPRVNHLAKNGKMAFVGQDVSRLCFTVVCLSLKVKILCWTIEHISFFGRKATWIKHQLNNKYAITFEGVREDDGAMCVSLQFAWSCILACNSVDGGSDKSYLSTKENFRHEPFSWQTQEENASEYHGTPSNAWSRSTGNGQNKSRSSSAPWALESFRCGEIYDAFSWYDAEFKRSKIHVIYVVLLMHKKREIYENFIYAFLISSL